MLLSSYSLGLILAKLGRRHSWGGGGVRYYHALLLPVQSHFVVRILTHHWSSGGMVKVIYAHRIHEAYFIGTDHSTEGKTRGTLPHKKKKNQHRPHLYDHVFGSKHALIALLPCISMFPSKQAILV